MGQAGAGMRGPLAGAAGVAEWEWGLVAGPYL